MREKKEDRSIVYLNLNLTYNKELNIYDNNSDKNSLCYVDS